MTKVLIEVDVAYPGEFYKTLESQASARDNAGEQGCLFHGVDDLSHNRVFVILEWSSTASARDFWRSTLAQAHMAAWNSVVPPRVVVLYSESSD